MALDLGQKTFKWESLICGEIVVPQTLVGVQTILNPWTFTLAPDPRCKMEREGSVAFVCLRWIVVCDQVRGRVRLVCWALFAGLVSVVSCLAAGGAIGLVSS